MLADAANLGDPGTTDSSGNFNPDWLPAFKKGIDGLILISGDSHASTHETMLKINKIFGVGRHNSTLHIVKEVVGDVRPGKESGHEQYAGLVFECRTRRTNAWS